MPYGEVPPLPVPPLPLVDVVVVVVVDVVVVVVAVVVGVVVDDEEVLVVSLSPLSEAMTTTATIRPMTAATSTAIAHLTPRLMPPVGG